MLLDPLEAVGRNREVFLKDTEAFRTEIFEEISGTRVLIIGGAGSIGSSVVHEFLNYKPSALHVVDINENNIVELMRELRIRNFEHPSELRIFAIDAGSVEFLALINQSKTYDYILNLSALKHVRSEGDPYTLMRMIKVNVLNNISLLQNAKQKKTKKIFCVSTDKAVDPFNAMGASKRLMELLLAADHQALQTSSARFANVAFSEGSLLDNFQKRFLSFEPLVGPSDIERFFITRSEAGRLCLLSSVLGKDGDIFVPNASDEISLQNFPNIATQFLKQNGYKSHFCKTPEEIRTFSKTRIRTEKTWPCYFTKSDATGEKKKEVFFSDSEKLELEKFKEIGVVKRGRSLDYEQLWTFQQEINQMLRRQEWTKTEILDALQRIVPNFLHLDLNKNLSDAI
jgi:FlaA1/EpsC-like NDP-sugar epimerase